ncbi:MAG: hypothetical protein ACRD3N_06785 [Terracidiphilus sp.]
MTAEPNSGKSEAPEKSPLTIPPPRFTRLPLPGLAAISLYMLLLAGTIVLGVAGGHLGPVFLFFSAIFVAAGLGLLLLLRWAWALTLAAVMLLAGLFCWRFSLQHAFPYLAQGLLNLVFFLYLVRGEVREKLK